MGRVAGDGLVYDGLGLGRLGFTAHGLSSSNRLAWPCSYSKTEMHERERDQKRTGSLEAQAQTCPTARSHPLHSLSQCKAQGQPTCRVGEIDVTS